MKAWNFNNAIYILDGNDMLMIEQSGDPESQEFLATIEKTSFLPDDSFEITYGDATVLAAVDNVAICCDRLLNRLIQ